LRNLQGYLQEVEKWFYSVESQAVLQVYPCH